MKIEPKTLKGFRDFLPPEARKREYTLNTLKKVFESYGFDPLETPSLEYEEILTGKYGDEGEKLMYKFEDNGGRRVALRYDQTVPLARVVAQYQNDIPFPFKRYQIQNVWRAENTQKGRYREFLQVDIDNVGSTSPLSDAEIISLVLESYGALGFKNIKILINDREVFEGLDPKAIIIVDKLEKIGADGVKEELKKAGFDENILDKIRNQKPTEKIERIFSYLKEIGIKEEVYEFSPTLARGLEYYTGSIFEIKSEDYSAGSLGGGGRYDNLIGMFTNRDIPAVGFSFGFDRTIEAMEELGLFPSDLLTTKVLVTVFSNDLTSQSLFLADYLREQDINAEVYSDDAPLEKQLKYANKKGYPFVLILGDDEVKNDKVILKDMKTGKQEELSPQELPNVLR